MRRTKLYAWGTMLLVVGCAEPPDDDLEVTDQAVVNGTPLSNSAAANSGVVMLEGPKGSGILLDPQWVLTAKHCFPSDSNPDADGDGWVDAPGTVTVTFGNLADGARVRRTADAILLHPDPGTDVALIHLSQPAPAMTLPKNHFTNGHLALYGGTGASLVGKTTTAMGYGMNVKGPPDPATGFGTLRTGRLKVTSAGPFAIATVTSTPDQQTNHGDSGGPRFYDLFNSDGTLKARFLVGVTVTGDDVNGLRSTAVSIEAFRGWVNDLVWGKLKTTIRAHSGFTNPGNMIDDDIATKSDLAKTQGTVDLDLGDTFTITRVAIAEDHAGTNFVGRYALQCWTGSAWGPQLFNVTTTVGTPQVNERSLSTTCTSNRVRVTLANGGNVEVFGIEIYGKPAGTRTLTMAATPSPRCGGNVTPVLGPHTFAPGPGEIICANSCRSYVFEGWTASPGIRLGNLLDNCTRVLDLRANSTVTARFHPANVFLNIDHGPNGTIAESGPFSVPYGTTFTIHATPAPGYGVRGYTYPDPGTDVPDNSNDLVLRELKQDGAVHVEFEIPWVGIRVDTPDRHGTISPADWVQVAIGANQLFTITPGPGYRMKEMCGTRWPDPCLPWTQNQFTLIDARSDDSEIHPIFEPIAPSRLATLKVLGSSGFASTSLLVDKNLGTKSTDGKKDAWIDLQLDRRYVLTKLEVAEDNAGSAEVKTFDVQCWNGSSFAAPLFSASGDVALPLVDHYDIPGIEACATDRVRVNFHNPTGTVEVFEVRVTGMPN